MALFWSAIILMAIAASDGAILRPRESCEKMGKYFDIYNSRALSSGVVPWRFAFGRRDHLLKYQCALEGLAGVDLALGRKDCFSTGSLVRLYYKSNTELTGYTLGNFTRETAALFGQELSKMKEIYEFGCYTKWNTSEMLCYFKVDY